jgi:hypothetical protein
LDHRISVRCFTGATSHREADGAPYGFYIVSRRVGCQHLMPAYLPNLVPEPAASKPPLHSRLLAIRRSSSNAFHSSADRVPIDGKVRIGGKSGGKLRSAGNMCGVEVTPHCGHIPRPFLAFWWEVSVRGLSAPGSRVFVIRPALPENRLKRWLTRIGK